MLDLSREIENIDPTNTTAVANLGGAVANTLQNVTTSSGEQLVDAYVSVVSTGASSSTLDAEGAQTLLTALAAVVNTNTSSLLSTASVLSTIESISKLLQPDGSITNTQLDNVGVIMDGLINSQLNTSDAAVANALRQSVQNTLLTALTATGAPVILESQSFTSYAALGQPQEVRTHKRYASTRTYICTCHIYAHVPHASAHAFFTHILLLYLVLRYHVFCRC